MVVAPSLYIDERTGVAIEIDKTFRELLDEPLYEQIEKIEVAYNPMNCTIDFLIKRRRDEYRARFEIPLCELIDSAQLVTVPVFQAQRDQLAKLILFLA